MKKIFQLLPYTEEKIFGFNRTAGQILGWQITKFNINSIWKKYTGKNITVAVIDTGCDIEHPDLKSNIIDGYNFVDNNNYPIDDNGHGTHVAGVISARNNHTGMVGVAPESKIMPLKALNKNGSGNSTNIAKAIIWAVDHNADIITMSLGSEEHSPEVYSAIKHAHKSNIVVFCAAGNFGNSHHVLYPAKYDETIAIGSIDENNNLSDFSCSGDELDFLSPGENIFSTINNGDYAIMSGTSMSNPFVVGCACLYIEYCTRNNISKPQNKKDYIEFFRSRQSKELIIRPQEVLI